MKKAIYKIENKITHKIYIGETSNPDRRFKEHINRKEPYTSLIHRAIKKYGEGNFSFEIIGWYENWKEMECYYIDYYKSKVPYGYNIANGGGSPPIHKGETHPKASISQEQADKIIDQFLDWKIPRKTIIKNNKITENIARHIISGDAWKREGMEYPLRPQETILNQYRVLYIQWMCCSSDLPLNQLGALVGWGRSSAKMINQGNNHFNAALKYPIRNNKEYNKKVLSQETCIDYLRFGE
jgi:group I intron endonuclease